MRRSIAFLATVALAVAGCGGGNKTVTVTHNVVTPRPQAAVPTSATKCLPGLGFMGCSEPVPPPNQRKTALPPPAGPEFPDVSSWQQHVNWSAVANWQAAHHWPRAAAFKMGEYVTDPYASYNSTSTANLHFWRAGYWFVRNTGITHELNQIISAGHNYNLKVIVLDEEVNEAKGYDVPLTNGLKKAGFIVVTYTGNGTWPSGSNARNPLWDAAYVNDFHLYCNRIWTCSPKAWQFTDGTYRSPVFVPGIGTDDVNVDYGIEKLGAGPPPDPFAIFPKTVFSFNNGKIKASEHNTVATWFTHNCKQPVKRPTCRFTLAHAVLLKNREWFIAHHTLRNGKWVVVKKARWSSNNLGVRFQQFLKITTPPKKK